MTTDNIVFHFYESGTTAQSDASPALWQKLGENDASRGDAIVKRVRSSQLGKLGLADEALERYNNTWEGFVSMVTDIRTLCPLLTMSQTQVNSTSKTIGSCI